MLTLLSLDDKILLHLYIYISVINFPPKHLAYCSAARNHVPIITIITEKKNQTKKNEIRQKGSTSGKRIVQEEEKSRNQLVYSLERYKVYSRKCMRPWRQRDRDKGKFDLHLFDYHSILSKTNRQQQLYGTINCWLVCIIIIFFVSLQDDDCIKISHLN